MAVGQTSLSSAKKSLAVGRKNLSLVGKVWQWTGQITVQQEGSGSGHGKPQYRRTSMAVGQTNLSLA